MIDSGQFSAWFARHAPAMKLYARQWLRDRDEAEDLVHEAFVALLTRMARADWREPENVGAWLFGVVRNLAMTHARSTSRRRNRETTLIGVARDACSIFVS